MTPFMSHRPTRTAILLVLGTFAAMLGGCSGDSIWTDATAAMDSGGASHTSSVYREGGGKH
jgi:hypothetical protein